MPIQNSRASSSARRARNASCSSLRVRSASSCRFIPVSGSISPGKTVRTDEFAQPQGDGRLAIPGEWHRIHQLPPLPSLKGLQPGQHRLGALRRWRARNGGPHRVDQAIHVDQVRRHHGRLAGARAHIGQAHQTHPDDQRQPAQGPTGVPARRPGHPEPTSAFELGVLHRPALYPSSPVNGLHPIAFGQARSGIPLGRVPRRAFLTHFSTPTSVYQPILGSKEIRF